jgi:hypothetical protein
MGSFGENDSTAAGSNSCNVLALAALEALARASGLNGHCSTSDFVLVFDSGVAASGADACAADIVELGSAGELVAAAVAVSAKSGRGAPP